MAQGPRAALGPPGGGHAHGRAARGGGGPLPRPGLPRAARLLLLPGALPERAVTARRDPPRMGGRSTGREKNV